MPAKVTCGCAHGIILVKTADSPPKLIVVAPGALGKGYAVLGRGEDALPVIASHLSQTPLGHKLPSSLSWSLSLPLSLSISLYVQTVTTAVADD